MRTYSGKQLDVCGPALGCQGRRAILFSDGSCQNRCPISPATRRAIASSLRDHSTPKEPWETAPGKPERPRDIPALADDRALHDIRTALHTLYQGRNILRRLGEVGLHRNDHVPLGVRGPSYRLL